MATAVDIGTLITKRPEMHSGRPCVAGTGTTVLAIVGWFKQGYGPTEIKELHFPHLPLAGILAALTYWAANSEEIDGYFREDQEAHEEWLAEVQAKR
jgi:uncharacterized protein (DUF433 family)